MHAQASKLRPYKGNRGDKGGYPGHLHIPSTYLVCENDRAIPPELQRKYIEAAVQAGAQMRTVVCDSAHSPQLKSPELVVQLIADAIQSSREIASTD